MSSAIEGLRPKGLWGHFEKLSEIPRPSKHEEMVLDYLKNMFTEKGLEWKQEKWNKWWRRKFAISDSESCRYGL